ncbi:MAG: SDR family NAD(P)-dependent oxidoreductase [Selenomonadaceae bacterium]|nr:SDR family NAD(P)-dependent oxidoreductase [Selenomonadaceae bacterium]
MIKPGDIYKIGNAEFKIIKVGSEVQKNLMNLGHITVKFDGGASELLEGSLLVEEKPIPDIKPGDELAIYRAEEKVADGSWLGLKGKTAIVTGAASGIGKAVAQAFLDNGANVVVCDLNPNEPNFELHENSGKVKYVITNVTDTGSVNAMIKTAIDTFGKIDILVNNAGINIPCLLIDPKDPYGKYELNDKVYDKVTGVNIKGVYLVAQAVGHEMVKSGGGVIINMSSESGLEGSEGQSIYAATKNAVNSFTRSWAKELGKYNIRVVGMAPGIMEATGLRTLAYEEALAYTRGITVEDLRKGYSSTKTTPLGRSGKLSEVADAVVFLASDRASYIHGVTYNVAGGKTRG